MENRTTLNNTNEVLGGDNMKETTILEGQLIDLITKKGELVHSTVNGEFYSYEYVLEKGNLTFILSLRDNDIVIQHDEIGEIDGMSFARKEEICHLEFGVNLYVEDFDIDMELVIFRRDME